MPGLTLVVRVVDAETGAPIARACVGHARTGQDGVAVLPDTAPWVHFIDVEADGYATRRLIGSLPDDPGGRYEHTIALSRGVALGGRVVDREGRPVGGAVVAARHTTDDFKWQKTRSDADGVWRLPGVATGKYELNATAPGFKGSQRVDLVVDGRRPLEDVTLALGEPRETRPRPPMTGDTMIAGVVLDEDGAPVGDVGVEVYMLDEVFGVVPRKRAQADPAGRFSVGPLPPGEYGIQGVRPGCPRDAHDNGQPRMRAKVGDHDIRVVLPLAGGISGVVADASGPVAVYGVVIHHDEALLMTSTPRIVRAADGRFTLPVIPPGTWVIAIFGEHFALQIRRDIVVAAGAVTDLGRIEVDHGVEIRGRVVDAVGDPVADADVTIGTSVDERPQYSDGWFAPLWDLWKRGTRTERSAADGRFAIANLGAGTLRAIATHATRGESHEVGVERGRPLELRVEVLGTIHGAVRGDFECILVEVAPLDEGLRPHAKVTRPDDTFDIEGVRPGRYRVRATEEPDDETPFVEIEVRAGETTRVELTFAPSDTGPSRSGRRRRGGS